MSSIIVWRIHPAPRAAEIFTGLGGLYAEGRWHPKGARIVYTAESRALAAMEVMANIPDRGQLGLQTWVIASVTLPEDLVERPDRYPENWRAVPAHDATRVFGDAWLASLRSPALRVPSAVVLGEFNYLLNPLHPDFARLAFGPPGPFHFDPRF